LLPLEAALIAARVQDCFPDWDARSRQHAILDDLARLGSGIPPHAMPERLDRGAVLGVMYVLEGSRLGARILARTVLSSPDSVVTAATAYLRHGDGQPLWSTFLQMLERHAQDSGHREAAVAGARMAFGMFWKTLSLNVQTGRPGHRVVCA
jgi:heme oxygenase